MLETAYQRSQLNPDINQVIKMNLRKNGTEKNVKKSRNL